MASRSYDSECGQVPGQFRKLDNPAQQTRTLMIRGPEGEGVRGMETAVSLAVLMVTAFLTDLAVLRICRSTGWRSPIACALPFLLGIGLTALGAGRILRGAAYGIILGGGVAFTVIFRGAALRRK